MPLTEFSACLSATLLRTAESVFGVRREDASQFSSLSTMRIVFEDFVGPLLPHPTQCYTSSPTRTTFYKTDLQSSLGENSAIGICALIATCAGIYLWALIRKDCQPKYASHGSKQIRTRNTKVSSHISPSWRAGIERSLGFSTIAVLENMLLKEKKPSASRKLGLIVYMPKQTTFKSNCALSQSLSLQLKSITHGGSSGSSRSKEASVVKTKLERVNYCSSIQPRADHNELLNSLSALNVFDIRTQPIGACLLGHSFLNLECPSTTTSSLAGLDQVKRWLQTQSLHSNYSNVANTIQPVVVVRRAILPSLNMKEAKLARSAENAELRHKNCASAIKIHSRSSWRAQSFALKTHSLVLIQNSRRRSSMKLWSTKQPESIVGLRPLILPRKAQCLDLGLRVTKDSLE